MVRKYERRARNTSIEISQVQKSRETWECKEDDIKSDLTKNKMGSFEWENDEVKCRNLVNKTIRSRFF